ncbi:MAG: choice-of-anchor J domain-containing protein [Muribaculum sp.]|nr:choice-of-anchor J domain-containing protein [Muribaculum sp.]
MNRTFLFAAAALVALSQSAGFAQSEQTSWTRTPDRPGRVETPRSSVGPAQKKDPRFQAIVKAEGRAVYDENAQSSITSRMLRDHNGEYVAKRTRANADIIGEIFGVCNNFAGQMATEDDYALSFWGKINFPGLDVTPLYSSINFCNTLDQANQTGAVRDGILYIPEGIRSSVRDFDVVWKRFDINTGKWLTPLACGDSMDLWLLSMCYDPASDSFYGLAGLESNGVTEARRLVNVKLNPVTGLPEAKVVHDYASGSVPPCGLFYYPATSDIYTFLDNYQICIVDRQMGTLIPVCELFCEEPQDELIVFAGFDQRGAAHLVYSPKDDRILMCVPDKSGQYLQTYIYDVDIQTGMMSRLGEIPGGYYMTTLYTPDSYAKPEAANVVELKAINLKDNQLSGSFDVVMPNTLYNGLELTQDCDLVITSDNVKIYDKAHHPGETVNVPFTLTEGLHAIVIRANVRSALPGPANQFRLYVGNDVPTAPTNLRLNGTTLSWDAPGAKGFNNGFVDTKALTYDVYFGEKKLNASPISSTSYTFTEPAELERVNITVTASANGHTSLKSEGLDRVIGKSIGLPYTSTPEAAQAALFTIVDNNGDNNTFTYDQQAKEFIHEYETFQGSNDWLILPAIYFDDPSKMYEFSCSFATATPYYGTENINICLGQQAAPSNMSTLITYPALQVAEGKKIKLSAKFSIEKAGTYYVAIHAATNTSGAGSRISNFAVQKLNASTGVVSAPRSVTVSAAPQGVLSADINVTVPTTDMTGKTLANKDVTVKVTNFDGDASHVGSATGKPGQTVKVSCPSVQGFNTYLVSVSNEYGDGPAYTIRGYVGIDVPKIVTGLKGVTSEDNRTMTLTWDPVTEGTNGGFIDPDNLEYQVWYNPQGVTWQRVGSPVKETSVVFDPQNDALARYRVSIFAQNSAGFLKAQTVDHVVEDILGDPVRLPLVEPFALGGVAYRWNYETRTAATENSSIRQILNEELAILGIGNPSCDDGSGRLVNCLFPGTACEAELLVPKFCTKGETNPVFRMRYWNHPAAPTFTVLARKYGQDELEEIGSWKPNPANNYSWEDYTLEIPEKYLNEQWVQLRLHFNIARSTSAYGVIDGIDIYSALEKDMKMSSLTANALTHVGDECTFTASAINAGTERVNAEIRGEVIGDGKVLDSQTYNISRLNALRSHSRRFTFLAKPDYLHVKDLKVKVSVILDGDQRDDNNSMEMAWSIIPSILPCVDDLSAQIKDSKVNLTWSAPEVAYGAYDDFEFLESFIYGEKIGQWTNLDRDKLETYAIGQLTDRWPGCYEKRAWQVVDAQALGTTQDARLSAYSGTKFLAAMAGYDPDSDGQYQVSKWLISPEVVGGSRVKFWINHMDITYRETIHVYYSTTDNKPESFIKLCNRSKEGSESWEQTYFDLPADAKYFALVYVGWDTLGVCIDDIEYEPANPQIWQMESYDVYRMRDGESQFSKISNVPGVEASDDFNGKDTYYYIVANCAVDEVKTQGPNSNVVLVSTSGVNAVETLQGVEGAKGEIIICGHAGKTANVYASDGKRAASFTVDTDNTRRKLDAGIYIVMIDKKAAKVIVK